MRLILKTGLLMVSLLLLFACSPNKINPDHPTALGQMQQTLQDSMAANKQLSKQQLPSAVQNALLPSRTFLPNQEANDSGTEQRFNLSVKDVPAQQFFMGLVKDTPYSVVVSPKVQGAISLKLKQVTVPEVLAAVHDVYGYQYKSTPYGFQITPGGLESRIFYVNYLNVSRQGQSRVMIGGGDISSKIGANGEAKNDSGNSGNNRNTANTAQGALNSLTGQAATQGHQARQYEDLGTATSSVSTMTHTDFWAELQRTLVAMVREQKGASVVVNPQAGMVIVRAYPEAMHEIATYLNSLQNTMERQVIIEAKILEVELKDGFQAGIDWSLLGASQGGTTLALPGISSLASAMTLDTSMFSANASAGREFSAAIQLLSTQGNVQVLSSPRISTLNNQKAVIKVGDDKFFVTNLTTSTLSSSGGTDQSQDIEMTPFFSGIALDVTPQIDSDGEVTLHIHPIVSRVSDDQKNITLGDRGDFTLPMATSTVRESDSIIRAKNGQIVVIGGLMEHETSEGVGKTPGLGDAPFVGSLFRRTNQQSAKTELVILLKPVVIENGSWNKQLQQSAKNYKQIQRGFHYGGQPDVFGTKAEKSPSWQAQKRVFGNSKQTKQNKA